MTKLLKAPLSCQVIYTHVLQGYDFVCEVLREQEEAGRKCLFVHQALLAANTHVPTPTAFTHTLSHCIASDDHLV